MRIFFPGYMRVTMISTLHKQCSKKQQKDRHSEYSMNKASLTGGLCKWKNWHQHILLISHGRWKKYSKILFQGHIFSVNESEEKDAH